MGYFQKKKEFYVIIGMETILDTEMFARWQRLNRTNGLLFQDIECLPNDTYTEDGGSLFVRDYVALVKMKERWRGALRRCAKKFDFLERKQPWHDGLRVYW